MDSAHPREYGDRSPSFLDIASPQIDADRFRRVLSHYPTGVCVITAIGENAAPVGMVVGTFTSVSLKPPLVGFFPARGSRSWAAIERAGKFCVNVLGSDQSEICSRFSAKGDDKFAGLAFRLSPGGSPLLEQVIGWIDCTVHSVHEAGDHLCVLGGVIAMEIEQDASPMLFCKGGFGAVAFQAAIDDETP